MCDSRPSHALSSLGSATVKRPSYRTGIPSRAQRWAVEGGILKYEAMAFQPFSTSVLELC